MSEYVYYNKIRPNPMNILYHYGDIRSTTKKPFQPTTPTTHILPILTQDLSIQLTTTRVTEYYLGSIYVNIIQKSVCE